MLFILVSDIARVLKLPTKTLQLFSVYVKGFIASWAIKQLLTAAEGL
jgi:hypothetical protein